MGNDANLAGAQRPSPTELHRPSKTAEAAAAARAIETFRRKSDRLITDPLAYHLLGPGWRTAVQLVRLPGIGPVLLAARERRYHGVLGSLLCRTRFIDEALAGALREGIRQVVILGAGFDSRAYRIGGIEQARVFEVDRPATLAQKQLRLRKILGKLPLHVSFVATDFDDEPLADVLACAGVRDEQPAMFIWEGVTQYLTSRAVIATLDYVAHAAAGSCIALTYLEHRIVNGLYPSQADGRLVRYMKRLGEPWISGFAPDVLIDDLSIRGMTVVDHVGAREYQDRYLGAYGRTMSVSEHERAILARLNEP